MPTGRPSFRLGRSRAVPALRIALAAAALATTLAACSGGQPRATASLPGPLTGRPTVVRNQPPVVWLSGQVRTVSAAQFVVVEEAGSRVAVRRLAEGATRYFASEKGRFVAIEPEDVDDTEAGTPVCAEALLDRGVYLAIRVFLGAACGPRG